MRMQQDKEKRRFTVTNRFATGTNTAGTNTTPAPVQAQSRPLARDQKMHPAHQLAFGGLYLFTLLLYVRPNELFPEVLGTFPIPRIVAVIAIVAYIGGMLGSGHRLTIVPIELKLLAFIAALGVLFAPLASSPSDSVDMLLDMFIKVIIIFILMINVINTHHRLRLMLSLVVVCGTIFAALAIKSFVVGDFTVVEKKDVGVVGLRIVGAVGGFFGNPNDLATSLNLLLPLAVALALTNKGLKRLLYLACGVVLIGGVIVTFSRGGFLGLASLGAVFLCKAGRHNRGMAALALAAILGVFVLAMPMGYGGRISSIFGNDPTGSNDTRRDLLERAVSIAAHHPIIGIGMGNFHIYSIHEQVAHNSYLEISSELGLAGLGAYLLVIFAPLWSLRRIERETLVQEQGPLIYRNSKRYIEHDIHYFSIALQAVLVAYIVCSFFGSIQYQWFLYYPVAYAIVLRRIHLARQESRAATPQQSTGKARGVIWGDGPNAAPAGAIARVRT